MGIIGDGNICLLIGRIFNDAGTGATYTAVSAAIEWAIQQNVKVINMSFGTPEISSLIKDATDQAARSGVILVASSGYVTAGEELPVFFVACNCTTIS
jgi:subtilisin family serine protease